MQVAMYYIKMFWTEVLHAVSVLFGLSDKQTGLCKQFTFTRKELITEWPYYTTMKNIWALMIHCTSARLFFANIPKTYLLIVNQQCLKFAIVLFPNSIYFYNLEQYGRLDANSM